MATTTAAKPKTTTRSKPAAPAVATPDSVSWDIPLEELKWRPSGAPYNNKIRYVPWADARTVMKHLDRIFGWDGWQSSFIEIPGGVLCELKVWSQERMDWIVKTDGSDNTDIEGTKGGISVALRRAAAHLGVGRNSYEVPELWAEYNTNSKGKPYAPRGIEPKLVKMAQEKLAAGEQAVNLDVISEEEEQANDDQAAEYQKFLDALNGLFDGSRQIIKEWWVANYKTPKPEPSDVGTPAWEALKARIKEEMAADPLDTVTGAFPGSEVVPDGEPF